MCGFHAERSRAAAKCTRILHIQHRGLLRHNGCSTQRLTHNPFHSAVRTVPLLNRSLLPVRELPGSPSGRGGVRPVTANLLSDVTISPPPDPASGPLPAQHETSPAATRQSTKDAGLEPLLHRRHPSGSISTYRRFPAGISCSCRYGLLESGLRG
ncbi:hypothetical protein D3C81_1680360 [compost metagenome]